MTTEGVDIPGLAARPTDLRGMARQIKWAVEHGVLDHPDSGPAFLATADQLEAMAATTVLVRAALLVAIELHGVGLEDHDEPGLPEHVREFETALRGAYRLLEPMAPDD
jgi:hypothetical protein